MRPPGQRACTGAHDQQGEPRQRIAPNAVVKACGVLADGCVIAAACSRANREVLLSNDRYVYTPVLHLYCTCTSLVLYPEYCKLP